MERSLSEEGGNDDDERLLESVAGVVSQVARHKVQAHERV